LGVWKSGPPPPFVCTDHMVRPNIVQTNATAEIMNGFCSLSGGTNT
jgi:hypothetical protein